MNGQMRQYENVLSSMCGPYRKSEIPNIKIDLKGITSFAKSLGKGVPELSDEQMQPFILNASVAEMKKKRIKL